MNTLTRLDPEELMHLALAASQRGQAAEAIDFLKRLIEISPDHAEAHHLLGAEHAQIGMFDRALEEFSRAIAIDPKLHTTRFQLGLLYLTMRRVEDAIETWKALEDLGPEHAFCLFKTGLIHLARDEFAECKANLEKGIAANDFSPPLNLDMQRVLDEIAGQSGAAQPETQADDAEGGSPHLFLSAYTTGKTKV